MRIFLSYASQDREQAKAIYLALCEQGHKIFFDRADLPAGEEYHNRIRAAIERSHLFLLLISPNAVDAGSYTLTELTIAEKCRARLLPVVLTKPDMERLPASISSVTYLETDGNVTGAVAAEVHRIARDRWWQRVKKFVVAAAMIAVISAVAFYAMRNRSQGELVGKDGAPLVAIPPGLFVMGDDKESPRREVFVDGFMLDKYEVTVARYAVFLKAAGNLKPPDEWETAHPIGTGDLPVVGVDWQDANGYCRWAGRRLPTEAEWEKAARGADGRKYPWGDDSPSAEHARYGKPYQNAVYQDGVVRVGSYAKGISAFGIHDLAGNVSEWVADWFSETLPRRDLRNPKGPEGGTDKVVRGGGWYDPPERITTTKRFHASPSQRSDDIGFRCAANVN